jgi:hypothetical protein
MSMPYSTGTSCTVGSGAVSAELVVSPDVVGEPAGALDAALPPAWSFVPADPGSAGAFDATAVIDVKIVATVAVRKRIGRAPSIAALYTRTWLAMRRSALRLVGAAWCVAVGLAACGDGGGIGATCAGNGDCASSLQCVTGTCAPLCQSARECGDGYACSAGGLCIAATGQAGDPCTSQVDCTAGLSCQIAGSGVGSNGLLLASCELDNTDTAGHLVVPDGAACGSDADCRNGTCALGRCTDLCDAAHDDRDCGLDEVCASVPRVSASGALYAGCLPSTGTIQFDIPVDSPQQTIPLPIPSNAQTVSVVMSIDDPNQEVGALSVASPTGQLLFDINENPFQTPVRTSLQLGQAVLQMPSAPARPMLATGDYSLEVASARPPFIGVVTIGSATPHVTVLIKVDSAATLDLHFYFLDLSDHPCSGSFDVTTLNAASASTSNQFQTQFLDSLFAILGPAHIVAGNITYEDALGHPDLDAIDVSNAANLLALGGNSTGVNVMVVRSLSPAGIEVFGPNPGPATLVNTPQSGIAIGLDTLCYRSWEQLGQLTAHELARYMGLYNNIELAAPGENDPIPDDDRSSNNLMFPAEFGSGSNYFGTSLSQGQIDILSHSTVLH